MDPGSAMADQVVQQAAEIYTIRLGRGGCGRPIYTLKNILFEAIHQCFLREMNLDIRQLHPAG